MAESKQTNFEELTVAEKIIYVQQLWDRIAEHPEDVELTDAQQKELDRRLQRFQDNPEETIAWKDVRASLGDDR